MTGIEGAREAHLATTVSGADIVKKLKNAEYIEDRTALADRIVEVARPGDSIICMTVNGYDNLVKELNDRLNR